MTNALSNISTYDTCIQTSTEIELEQKTSALRESNPQPSQFWYDCSTSRATKPWQQGARELGTCTYTSALSADIINNSTPP